MPTYLPTIIILSAAVLAVLIVLYRLYDSRVEQPKKLEDELREGLTDADGRRYKADVMALEPVRKAAAASSYDGNRVIIVRNFGKIPHRPYTMQEFIGIEIFVDDRVVGRMIRGVPPKLLDDIAPVVNRVTMRLIFDDPGDPDFELVLWDPHDNLTARAEGPRAAMNNARKWFYHAEAVLRRTANAPAPKAPPVTSPPPAPPPLAPPAQAAAAPVIPSPAAPAPAAPPSRPEGDVLNAPLIPYI